MTTGLAISRRARRSFSKEFKSQVVAECAAGTPTAAVALAHGLNTNMVWKWVRRAQTTSALAVSPAFVPVVPPVSSRGQIEVNLQRGEVRIEVRWPAGEASACAAWLRELLR